MRIPTPKNTTPKQYFEELYKIGLLYHLDDDILDLVDPLDKKTVTLLNANMSYLLQEYDMADLWEAFPDARRQEELDQWKY